MTVYWLKTRIMFSKSYFLLTIVIICNIQSSHSGLLSGDLKLNSAPLTINRHGPLVININEKNIPPLPPLSLPKPEKPPPLSDQVFSPSKPLLSAVSPFKVPSLLPIIPPILPPILPPLLPKLPLLPLLPLPPIIPPIPLLPLMPPFLPKLPRRPLLGKSLIPPSLKDPLKPLKVPILGGKTPIEKAISKVTRKIKRDKVSAKLKDLLKKGSLSTTEFNRFKRLLTK